MIKITSPFEVLLAMIELEVIRGSKRVIATMVEMNTKIDVKKRVMLAWMRCVPVKHWTEGKYCRTEIFGLLAGGLQLMILRRNSTMGMNRNVTKRGTICASRTSGSVNLNFFFVKE
jgi:hypothetical protein